MSFSQIRRLAKLPASTRHGTNKRNFRRFKYAEWEFPNGWLHIESNGSQVSPPYSIACSDGDMGGYFTLEEAAEFAKEFYEKAK